MFFNFLLFVFLNITPSTNIFNNNVKLDYHGLHINPKITLNISNKEIKDLLSSENFLNKKINDIADNNSFQDIVVSIPSITDINHKICSIKENQTVISKILKIKNLNTNKFEKNGKELNDPFNLSEQISLYQYMHLEQIFLKNIYRATKLAIASTLIVSFIKKPIIIIPNIAYIIPFFVNYKSTSIYLKNIFNKEEKLHFFTLSLFIVGPMFLIYGVNFLLYCIKQKIF